MSSFYGGKQGRTYNIVHNYSSVQQMVLAFNNGGQYTDVNYGQYVIIDTIDKNSPQNGLLFRRGFDYSQEYKIAPNINDATYTKTSGNDTYQDYQVWKSDFHSWAQNPGGGAIYVGQIVGPSGAVPAIHLETWSDFVNHENSIHKNNASTHQGFAITTPGYIPADESLGTTAVFNDDINFGLANVKDQNQQVSEVHLGVDIPYTVFEADIDSDPYKQSSVVESTFSEDHPFYYKWDFTIPGGKHGADLINFEIKNGNEIEQYFPTQDETVQQEKIYYKVILNEETHQWEFSAVENPIDDDIEEYYELQLLESNNQNQFLTYRIKDYSSKPEGVVSEDLGLFPWKVIDNITAIDSNRQVLDATNIPVSNIQLGDLVFISGNKYLICIRDGINNIINSINQEDSYQVGDILPINADETNVLWRVIEISTQAPPHGLNIDYTYGESTQVTYPVYDYFYIDNTGNLFVKRIENNQQYYDYISTLDSIINMDINHSDGTITINYISGKTQTLPFKTLNTIKLQSDKTLSQQFLTEYKYNEEIIEEEVSGTVNTILALRMKGDLLLALYSDPSYRQAAIDGKIENKDYFYLEWTDPSPVPEGQERLIYDGGTGANHRPLLPWIKISSTNNQYHLFTCLSDFSELLDGGIYANGLTDGREGWLIQVNYQQDNQPTKSLFAFDYNCIGIDDTTDPPSYTYNRKYSLPPGSTIANSCWFEVMSIKDAVAANPKDHLLISEAIEENNEIVPIESDDQLKTNGIWFIVSSGHD